MIKDSFFSLLPCLHTICKLLSQVTNRFSSRQAVGICNAANHPIMDHNGRIFCALLGIDAAWKTLDCEVRVTGKEEGDAESLIPTSINDSMEVGQVAIVRPSHHQISQIDDVSPGNRSHIDPFR